MASRKSSGMARRTSYQNRELCQDDIVVMIGHLNAQLGWDNTLLAHVTGKFGLANRNHTGGSFMDSSLVAHYSSAELAISLGFN